MGVTHYCSEYKMPLFKRDAERCLALLWKYRSLAEVSEHRLAYEKAIASLHAYLTDVLPAALPARVTNGIFRDEDVDIRNIELSVGTNEKLGVVLDSIDVNGWSEGGNTISSIVISLLRPNSAASRDGRLVRGDQILSINDHSLSQVSLQRAR